MLQLVLYSDLLAEIQDLAPAFAHIELGDGKRVSLRLTDYVHYARAMRARLEAFIADPAPVRPVPCADCVLCRWADHCQGVWDAEDSLFNVAGITRTQVKKLESSAVSSMADGDFAVATHPDTTFCPHRPDAVTQTPGQRDPATWRGRR